MRIYGVVDRKAKSFVSVFTSASDEAAKRSFLMLLTSPVSNVFTDFPEDFDLYALADLSFNGQLKVSHCGSDDLEKAGFTFDSFIVTEPLNVGSDYDKRYLEVLRTDRAVDIIAKAEEKYNNERNNDTNAE